MPSIRDVAKIAGVAVGTVSRVINNSGSVKPDTRRKVEKAIQELNYFPNEVARNFKMRKSKMVALLLPSIWHPFFLNWLITLRMSWIGKALSSCYVIAAASQKRNCITWICYGKTK
uniref:LacI family DNA-binding transcriptional regulator n=1 Tax=Paenibacillus polymyxa TaxID=1406 RepID=A0AAE9PSV1_PAEPO